MPSIWCFNGYQHGVAGIFWFKGAKPPPFEVLVKALPGNCFERPSSGCKILGTRHGEKKTTKTLLSREEMAKGQRIWDRY